MCCSVTPHVPVRFSDTVLYAAEVFNGGRAVHVLGYQNRVQNRAGQTSLGSILGSWVLPAQGNAMILPFPAVPRTMTDANVLDTSKCRDVLQDVADSVTPRLGPVMVAASRGSSTFSPPRVQVFEAAGIYTVVLAQDARDIPAALQQVPKSKRPLVNPELFEAYAAWYPDWTIALCCFNNRRARLASPMLWWYEPMFPDQLFLPAVDGHTGDVPDLDAEVAVDHVLAVSCDGMRGGQRVYHERPLPEAVRPYIQPNVIGTWYGERMRNGDFVCSLADVREGRFNPVRTRPAAVAA